MNWKPSLWTSFKRSQLASVIATLVDFAFLVGMVEFLHVWYVAATAIGAFAGAVTHFILGRHWSFAATHARFHDQAFRYALVSGGSLLLNSAGVYFLTDVLRIQYVASRVLIGFAVGLCFNFPLHRHFVFR